MCAILLFKRLRVRLIVKVGTWMVPQLYCGDGSRRGCCKCRTGVWYRQSDQLHVVSERVRKRQSSPTKRRRPKVPLHPRKNVCFESVLSAIRDRTPTAINPFISLIRLPNYPVFGGFRNLTRIEIS